jgi:hypothetical protein
MYNPMYYSSDHYKGAGTSTIAKYWRISSGGENFVKWVDSCCK